VAAYTANITEAIETVLEADQIATVLRSYMDATSKFEGTASEMLKSLNCIVPETQQKAKGWPKRPANLAKTLRRIAAPLRKVGIDIACVRASKGPDTSPSHISQLRTAKRRRHRQLCQQQMISMTCG
jgi:hypothetical protein